MKWCHMIGLDDPFEQRRGLIIERSGSRWYVIHVVLAVTIRSLRAWRVNFGRRTVLAHTRLWVRVQVPTRYGAGEGIRFRAYCGRGPAL